MKFVPITHCQPTDQSYLVGEHCRKLMTEERTREIKKD
jgi:hypothetical protein